jgi:hypothetical protein
MYELKMGRERRSVRKAPKDEKRGTGRVVASRRVGGAARRAAIAAAPACT